MDLLAAQISLAVALFISTNLDDIFVLLSFFADPKYRPRNVVIGQYSGALVLFAASLIAALVALVIPGQYIGLLGFAPIFIGLRKLWGLRSRLDDGGEHPVEQAGHGQIVSVMLVTIANGGDNFSIYTPVFATIRASETALIGIVFALMTAAWLAVGHWMVHHKTIGRPIRLYGARIVPVILIGLGFYIFCKADSFELMSRLASALGHHLGS